MISLREELFNRQLSLETEGIELGIAKVQKDIVEAKQKGSYGDTSASSVIIVERKRF